MILAAPLQGFTTAVFRRAHWETIGGVTEYFAPFMRLEQGGLRKKDRYDTDPVRQGDAPVVPQILVQHYEEGKILVEYLRETGFRRIDFNFCCPFVKVVRAGYGAAMADTPERMRQVLRLTREYPDIRFSAKLRLESVQHAVLLRDHPLVFLTLHPRGMMQGYDGVPDRAAYEKLAGQSACPVIYNGDITAPEPALQNVMIGRGLLADPALPLKWTGQTVPATLYRQFLDRLAELAMAENGGLDYLKTCWEYFLPAFPKRCRKKILKSRTAEEYRAAVEAGFGEWQTVGDGADA